MHNFLVITMVHPNGMKIHTVCLMKIIKLEKKVDYKILKKRIKKD